MPTANVSTPTTDSGCSGCSTVPNRHTSPVPAVSSRNAPTAPAPTGSPSGGIRAYSRRPISGISPTIANQVTSATIACDNSAPASPGAASETATKAPPANTIAGMCHR